MGGRGVVGGGSTGNAGMDGVAGLIGLGIDPSGLAMGEIEESCSYKLVDRLDKVDLLHGTHL